MMIVMFVRYRIESAFDKRIASQQPPYSKTEPYKKSSLFQRIDKILRTGRVEPTGRRKQGRDEFLIKPYEED